MVGELNNPVKDIALYVHWPFCLNKCPYCDFNSHVREQVDSDLWRSALLQELEHFGQKTKGRKLTSVFFGGGTPSLMAVQTVGSILESLGNYWSIAEDIEITLEANPTSVEAEKFAGFRAAGVNRLSLGIQSLNEQSLKFLGRQHSRSQAVAAIDLARRHFPRFSFDLIYALPDQNLSTWGLELDEALKLAGDHLSLYQLTLEENTGFYGDFKRGVLKPLDDDIQAELFEFTNLRMSDVGLPAYEISNYAKPGQESRHNLTYWHYRDYLGVGPGAHGRFVTEGHKTATMGWKKPETWLEHVKTHGHGVQSSEVITPAQQAEEALMMGLRLRDGVDLSEIERITGLTSDQFLNWEALKDLTDLRLIHHDPQRHHLQVTTKGQLLLNAILGKLVV